MNLTQRRIHHILIFMGSLLLLSRWSLRFLLPPLLLSTLLIAATKDPWIEVRSPHFSVVSDAGEKQARRIADQFEQIREVFHEAFPTLRADLSEPVTIFALKNEDSMKALLPAYWEVKGHMHPAGLYISGEDKHYVVVRANIQGDNAYEVVYHEYAHALENLNFQGLPLCLSEGVAEFLGNSRIHESFVEIGAAAPHHLEVLRENKLIPIDVLVQVDSTSPYYNEDNRASMFYAESWTLVHYLMMDPEARQKQLLQNFLAAYQASGKAVDAAQKTFGDLNQFARAMELYSRQDRFFVGRVNTSIHGDPKSYSHHALAPAEVDALRGDLYTRTQRKKEATDALRTALRENPNLPQVHEALGVLALSEQETEEAEAEFTKAVQLNSSSFLAYYYSARARMRYEMNSPAATQQVITDLEKTISLNPNFAPAYEALSSLYSYNPATIDKAIITGKKAMQLEPGTVSYAVSYGYVLLRIGKVADAKVIATRIQAVAKTPDEVLAARKLTEVVISREAYDAQEATYARRAQSSAGQQDATSPRKTNKITTPEGPPINKHEGENEYAIEGTVASAECGSDSPGKVILTANTRTLMFRISRLDDLQVLVKNEDVSEHPPACSEWRTRRARLFFYKWKDKEFYGELSTIQFF
jgi:tetratricopeptide (TPR) repeat protein